MYVTRPLSLYRRFPGALSLKPPEAPCSGFLIIRDEESEAIDNCCFGVCKNRRIKRLPIPQDKIMKVVHPLGYDQESSVTKVWFIPVLDLPLSSNRYHVIKASGRYKGLAYTCSREQDISTCCFGPLGDVIIDAKPKPFDPRDIYQQIEIRRYYNGGFYAKSVASDGFPPKFLRGKGWEVHISSSFRFHLREAQGLINSSLQSPLPEFDFPLPCKRSSLIVLGKWYCPFVHVKEGIKQRHRMENSLVYELSLEKWWEEIYSCENEEGSDGNFVGVSEIVEREVDLVYGMRGLKDDRFGGDGFIWFRAHGPHGCKGVGVGLSWGIVEKMRWVQEREGWVGGEEREVRVERVEEIRSESGWRRFSCYVLVESFVLRRMDGVLLLNCQFRHTQRLQCKWE